MTRTPQTGTIHALIGAQGHILSADAPVLRLQSAAGGDPEGLLLVPQLAALARLAQKLRLLIARPVFTGSEGTTISMWARATPREDGVELVISDWREMLVPVPGQAGAQRAADIALAAEGWGWQIDGDLCFVDAGHMGEAAGARPQAGTSFTTFFRLDGDAGGENAVLAAIAQRRAFFDEHVGSAAAHGPVYSISGHPLFDGTRAFVGFRGKASALPQADTACVEQGILPDIGKRIDLALRQPLGRIIANAETISGQLEGPLRLDYAAYAADIADAGRHLMELVDDLADLQAIDRPNFQVAQEDIDLADIARRAAGLLGLKAVDRHIRIEAPPAGETMPAVGEFRRALQILVNLVGNAVRYSPEHSLIWLRADGEGEMARLIVADQGPGVASEDHDKLFEKFERLGRQDAMGSGLGLYISRRLARAMGGDIHLDSAPGQGARFILSLPKR